MKRSSIVIATLLGVLGFLLGCPGQSAFKSTDQELMRELRTALKEAKISFEADEEGFLRYSAKDAPAVKVIRDNLQKELHTGVTVKYDETEATQYFRALLTSREMKYRIEKRTDGEWTRWYPLDAGQQNEISRKVIDHISEVRKARLSPNCKQEALSPC